MFVKVSNLIQSDGRADYKGLDLSKIVAGTQFYPENENVGYFEYIGEIVEHADIQEITQEEYETKKEQYFNSLPLSMSDELKLMKQALDDLILNGGA